MVEDRTCYIFAHRGYTYPYFTVQIDGVFHTYRADYEIDLKDMREDLCGHLLEWRKGNDRIWNRPVQDDFFEKMQMAYLTGKEMRG